LRVVEGKAYEITSGNGNLPTGATMSESYIRRGPMDQLSPSKMAEVKKWDMNGEAQAQFQAQFREFIETKPLYSNFKITLPPGRVQFRLEVARLHCWKCNTTQPFRMPEHSQWYHFNDKNLRSSDRQIFREFDLLMNSIYPLELVCQECKRGFYDFFIHVNVDNGSVTKFGQVPMWTPRIDKELREALGKSTPFYLRALQNLNMSYGIGACAYFRRMIEDYINPLLTLLHDYKQDAGASEEELADIKKAIASKNFSAKTEYAAQICPQTLIVAGMNPLKELHDLLSYNIHAGTNEEATEIALKIKSAIEFVVKSLRRHYDEQKQFVETMKRSRNTPEKA
jgi:hypothetical protein